MPYLRGDLDRDRFPEEVYWFLAMGPSKALSLVGLRHEPPTDLPKLLSDSRDTDGEHIEEAESEPPTPPYRPSTPRVTIAPCPVRLRPLIPPANYGAVEPHTIYRSGKPMNDNVDFLQMLRLQSMLSLVNVEVEQYENDQISNFLEAFAIDHEKILIQKNKGALETTADSLCEALLFIMNPINHPVYIHCNMGKHRTGCVVACLRKCQQWPIDEILAEYKSYAGDKARERDIEVIKAFHPSCVYEYARSHNRLIHWPRTPRQDSAADIWDLASSLPAHELSQIPRCNDKLDDADAEDDSDNENGLTMTHGRASNGLSLRRHHSKNEGSMVADVTVSEADDDERELHDVQVPESMASTVANTDCTEEPVALYHTARTLAVVVSASRSSVS